MSIQTPQAGFFCGQLYDREKEIDLYRRACDTAEDLVSALQKSRWRTIPGLIRRLNAEIAAARSVTDPRPKYR